MVIFCAGSVDGQAESDSATRAFVENLKKGTPLEKGVAFDTLVVHFDQPSKGKRIHIHSTHGAVRVEGYDGDSLVVVPVYVEDLFPEHPYTREMVQAINPAKAERAAENWVNVSFGSEMHIADLNIKAPRNSTLHIKSWLHGDVVVKGMERTVEILKGKGDILLSAISGNAIAETAYGNITCRFDKITPLKPYSFIVQSGTIDLTLPDGAQVDVNVEIEHFGELHNEFEDQAVEIQYHHRGEASMKMYQPTRYSGRLNDGGAKMQISTLNGEAYLRKKQ